MEGVEFTLLDMMSDMVTEWKAAFEEHTSQSTQSRLTYLNERLEELAGTENGDFDCVVSPANSYGRLDGSFDHFLATILQPADNAYRVPTEVVQQVLYSRWKGYAPPGTCTLIPLKGTPCANNKNNCSFIALCPTMRTPEKILSGNEVVYNCIWSLLNAIDQHNASCTEDDLKIRKVLLPGMGTGVGLVSFKRCAQQTALAFKHYEEAKEDAHKWSNIGWGMAQRYSRTVRVTEDL